MQTSLKYMAVAFLMLIGSSAWSDCACFCVEGELTTMCTEVGDAQNNPNLCPTNTGTSASCPQQTGADTGTTYEAPDADAVNCRNIRVYDAIRSEYVTTKACNVI